MTATLESTLAPAPDAAFGRRLIPAGDPLAGAAFDAIYDSRIKPELVKCERDRQGAVGIFAGGGVLTVLLVALEAWMTSQITHGQSAIPNTFVLVCTIVFVPLVAYIPLGGVGARAKRGVIQALCEPIGVTYALTARQFDGFPTFRSLHLLPAGDTAFTDVFAGRRGEVGFTLCNARLEQGSGKNRHTVFQGQLFHLATPRRMTGTTVVLRNSGWLNLFEKPKGLEPIGLEDPAFNKTFVVFGSDQVEAREILTPAFMQELNELETAYRAAHLRCAFQTGELFLAMQGASRFGIGSLFASLVDRGRVEHIARDIEQVFKLIDGLTD